MAGDGNRRRAGTGRRPRPARARRPVAGADGSLAVGGAGAVSVKGTVTDVLGRAGRRPVGHRPDADLAAAERRADPAAARAARRLRRAGCLTTNARRRAAGRAVSTRRTRPVAGGPPRGAAVPLSCRRRRTRARPHRHASGVPTWSPRCTGTRWWSCPTPTRAWRWRACAERWRPAPRGHPGIVPSTTAVHLSPTTPAPLTPRTSSWSDGCRGWRQAVRPFSARAVTACRRRPVPRSPAAIRRRRPQERATSTPSAPAIRPPTAQGPASSVAALPRHRTAAWAPAPGGRARPPRRALSAGVGRPVPRTAEDGAARRLAGRGPRCAGRVGPGVTRARPPPSDPHPRRADVDAHVRPHVRTGPRSAEARPAGAVPAPSSIPTGAGGGRQPCRGGPTLEVLEHTAWVAERRARRLRAPPANRLTRRPVPPAGWAVRPPPAGARRAAPL